MASIIGNKLKEKYIPQLKEIVHAVILAGIMAVYEEECSSRVSSRTGSQMGAERYILNRFCNGNGNM